MAPEGSVVALEALDDVDVVEPDGSVIAEQAKSGLATNPISDWSIDLWKTFANWIDAIEAGNIDLLRTNFHLYVVQKKTGGHINKLKYAHTDAQALEIVDEIRAQYLAFQPSGCKVYIEKFLNYYPDKLAKLIVQFDYKCGDSDPVKPIKQILSNTVADVSLDDVCCAAIGWVKIRSDELIGARKHSGLEKDAFADWLSTYCTKFSYDYLLTYTAHPPSKSEVESHIPNFPTMMRQLDLIERAYRDKVKAMTDFMQAKTNKTRWAEMGIIDEAHFKDFEEDLEEQWEAQWLRINGTYSLNDLEKGRAIYLECRQLTQKINGKEAPNYFSRGTFHFLSDTKKIGWHPNYKVLL